METEAMDVQQQDGGQGGTPDRVVPQENHVHTTLPQASRKPDVTGEKQMKQMFSLEKMYLKLSNLHGIIFLSIMTFHPTSPKNVSLLNVYSPSQWMGAVRMRLQTADKNITIIHTTPVHNINAQLQAHLNPFTPEDLLHVHLHVCI